MLALVCATKGGAAQESRQNRVKDAIRLVWKHDAAKAISVAYCESRFSIWARNGQYVGIFQQGDWSRSTYYRPHEDGYFWGWWAQIRSAHRQFEHEGWTPWSCA
jgi:hypothetical protein